MYPPYKIELNCIKSKFFVNDLLVYSILSYNSKFHKIWLKTADLGPFEVLLKLAQIVIFA